MAKNTGIAKTVWELVAPTAETLGLSLWDVEFLKEGADMVLRITVDKADGVTIDDCEKMHRAIDPLLDEADPIECSYTLEVSSPGLERELKSPAHFLASVGKKTEVRLFAPREGQRVFRGTLEGLDEGGNILLRVGDVLHVFSPATVAKASTVFDF